jgi:hypothetical protein
MSSGEISMEILETDFLMEYISIRASSLNFVLILLLSSRKQRKERELRL